MPPPKPPAYYRERAEQCEKLARETKSPHVREAMLYVSLRWRELANSDEAKKKAGDNGQARAYSHRVG